MTGERFNEYQLKAIGEAFGIVKNLIAEIYEGKTDGPLEEMPHQGDELHWQALNAAIRNFPKDSAAIMDNRLEDVSMERWIALMFLVETLEHNDLRQDNRRKQVTRRAINLLVGMFRGQFNGALWNPDEIRWSTQGDGGGRGVSPMLMAIAEL